MVPNTVALKVLFLSRLAHVKQDKLGAGACEPNLSIQYKCSINTKKDRWHFTFDKKKRKKIDDTSQFTRVSSGYTLLAQMIPKIEGPLLKLLGSLSCPVVSFINFTCKTHPLSPPASAILGCWHLEPPHARSCFCGVNVSSWGLKMARESNKCDKPPAKQSH